MTAKLGVRVPLGLLKGRWGSSLIGKALVSKTKY